MREGRMRVLILSFLPLLVGCATASTSSTVGEVQEVAPGTYKIGVGHTVRIGHEMEDDAVSKAGQYCHAKGQKLVIVPTKDKDVTFQCGEKIQVPATPVTQEPATAAPVQLKPPDGAAQATRPEAALPREELRQDMQRDRA